MSDVTVRLSVKDALDLRRMLRGEVEMGFERFSGEMSSPSRAERAYRHMMTIQDAIEEGHDYYDKGTVS